MTFKYSFSVWRTIKTDPMNYCLAPFATRINQANSHWSKYAIFAGSLLTVKKCFRPLHRGELVV